ncbi:MAG: hypothetical protein GXP54_13180 [Deltaproteobacteria bacterium]|nr:hypothetical protein [Deltaproteobacteria bacterium]
MTMHSDPVRVSLDHEERSFKAGEEITGEVVLAPTKDLKCESLVLECVWAAVAGDNEDDEGVAGSVVLEEGFEVAAGEVRTFRFSIEAPSQPLTYAGKMFTVGWAVAATAKQPPRFIVGKDPQAAVGFELVADNGRPYEYMLPDGKVPEEPGAPPDMAGPAGLDWASTLFFLGFVGGGAYGTFLAMTEMFATRGPDERVPYMIGYGILALFAAAFAVGAALMLFSRWRLHTTSAALGRVDLDIGPAPVSRGGVLHCKARLTPPARITLRGARARFEVVEGYTYSWFSRDRLTRHYKRTEEVVRKEEVPFSGVDGMDVVGEAVLERDIPVPEDLPCSMYARNNQVHVRLVLEIDDTSGRVKWNYRGTLVVVP